MFRLFRRKPSHSISGQEAPPPPGRKPRFFRRRRRPPTPRHSRGLYVLAFIGLAAVVFLLIRYLVIPLLVELARFQR